MIFWIEFDKDNKKIVLSATELEKQKEAKMVEEYNASQKGGEAQA